MTCNERVVKALKFEKTDRVPQYEIFLHDFINSWLEETKIPASIDIYDYYSQVDIGNITAYQYGPYLSTSIIVKRSGHEYFERDSCGRLLYKKGNSYFEKEIEAMREFGKS